jgi:membrane fusion protein, multidrug efflux system
MAILVSQIRRFAFLCVVSTLAACGEEKKSSEEAPKQSAPIDIGIIVAKAEAITVTNNLPGRISPTRLAEVRSRISGIVIARVFEQGSQVKEGDVLYKIDPAPFKVRVESAQATLKRAEAGQLQASQQSDRVVELRERNVASVQQKETAVGALAQADADVAAAQANLSAAQLDLQYTEVKAPITGRIGRALITEGALVGSSAADNLATIQQLNPVYADFTQSAGDLLALRRALKVGELTGPNQSVPNVRLLFDDGSEYKHLGHLLFSEATVDVTTGQVTLRGEFPNPEGDLLPGMYVRVMIDEGSQADAIAVPQQAVQRDESGRAQLYLLKPDGTLELRPIKEGRTINTRVVVDEGLKVDEQVVTEGFQKIRPDAKFKGVLWKPEASADSASGKRG